MQHIFDVIESVAKSDANILIAGESGTGKELIANAIHLKSLRAKHRFVKINCAALPKELIENELFGHVKGAFTGADRDKPGLIAAAAGGSLLLDEIAEMPVELQPKLLRMLQERQYQRVGSEQTVKADFRLISSTNRQPTDALDQGLLREDLYYRIATVTIEVPPLRERPEDIQLLADGMLKRQAEKYARPVTAFTSSAGAALLGYDWPGNVRELENVVERAVLLSSGTSIKASDLQFRTRGASASKAARPVPPREEPPATTAPAEASHENGNFYVPFGMSLDEIERRVIEQALNRTKGNKQAAATSLGIYRARLYTMLKKHGLG
jgi:transcriptional regulator with PAS, ATPase and Fis domain